TVAATENPLVANMISPAVSVNEKAVPSTLTGTSSPVEQAQTQFAAPTDGSSPNAGTSGQSLEQTPEVPAAPKVLEVPQDAPAAETPAAAPLEGDIPQKESVDSGDEYKERPLDAPETAERLMKELRETLHNLQEY